MGKLIVGFGEALVDVLPSGEVVGGAPLNFSIRAAQLAEPLGWTAAMISRIGSDHRGEKILQHLRQTRLDTSAIQIDPNHPTGFVDVKLDDGHPSYVIGQHVAWDHIGPDEAALNLSRQASAFCFGTLAQRGTQTRETLAECLRAVDRGVKIFDINLRKPYPTTDLIDQSLRAANILKCNAEELLLLAEWLELDLIANQQSGETATSTCEQSQVAQTQVAQNIATMLQARFELDCVFWTQGAQGCVLQRGAGTTTANVPQLPQAPDADSVGAGDAASAALAVGLVAGWPDERIATVANYCGAFAASQRGATTPFPPDFLGDI